MTPTVTVTMPSTTTASAKSTVTTTIAPPATRDSIHLSDSEILAQTRHPGDQFILTLRAPEAARTARAGSFAHIQCDADIPDRKSVV